MKEGSPQPEDPQVKLSRDINQLLKTAKEMASHYDCNPLTTDIPYAKQILHYRLMILLAEARYQRATAPESTNSPEEVRKLMALRGGIQRISANFMYCLDRPDMGNIDYYRALTMGDIECINCWAEDIFYQEMERDCVAVAEQFRPSPKSSLTRLFRQLAERVWHLPRIPAFPPKRDAA